MDSVVSFGGVSVYVFDQDNQTHISDNFNDLVTRTNRMVGVSGGFDELGAGPAPRSVGNVRLEGWLQADSPAQMTEQLRQLGIISSVGVLQLVKQPMDTTLPTVYCDARLNTINYVQSAVRLPRQQIKITANFNVANPGWIGEEQSDVQLVFAGETNSLFTSGNAYIYPVITILVGDLVTSVDSFLLEREVDSVVVDRITYNTQMAADDVLVIDTRAKSVKLNGANSYSSDFSTLNAGWFKLAPDAENILPVLITGSSPAIFLTIDWNDVWMS